MGTGTGTETGTGACMDTGAGAGMDTGTGTCTETGGGTCCSVALICNVIMVRGAIAEFCQSLARGLCRRWRPQAQDSGVYSYGLYSCVVGGADKPQDSGPSKMFE